MQPMTTNGVLITVSPQELEQRLEAMAERIVERLLQATADDAVTPAQAAKLLGKSVSTVQRMDRRGELTRLHPFGRPRYSKRQVVQHVKKNI